MIFFSDPLSEQFFIRRYKQAEPKETDRLIYAGARERPGKKATPPTGVELDDHYSMFSIISAGFRSSYQVCCRDRLQRVARYFSSD